MKPKILSKALELSKELTSYETLLKRIEEFKNYTKDNKNALDYMFPLFNRLDVGGTMEYKRFCRKLVAMVEDCIDEVNEEIEEL